MLRSIHNSQGRKAQDYMEIKNTQLLQQHLQDPKLMKNLEFANYLLLNHLEQLPNRREHDKLLIEMFNSDFVLSKLYGLELHLIKTEFQKYGNKIRPEAFVVCMMKIIDFELDQSPYVLNGLRKLADILAVDNIIDFDHFIKHYVSCSNNVDDDDQVTTMYHIKESEYQDKQYHRHEIQKAIVCKALQKIAVLEENQSEIKLFDLDLKVSKIIKPDEDCVGNYIIMDFDYSDELQEIGCSLSNNSLVFWSLMEQFNTKKTVESDHLLVKLSYLILLNQWIAVTTNQQMILYSDKDHIPTKLGLTLQGGKVQQILEIMKLRMVCFQTDLKRVHICNQQFDTLIIIKDTLLFQSIVFYEPQQCLLSTNYTQKLQKWLIEESGVDYTKDKTIHICKPEFSILAIAFISGLLVTYDSSYHIRVFDMDEFKKLTNLKKVLKSNNRMRILDLGGTTFAIVGNRLTIFEIQINVDDKLTSGRGQVDMPTINHIVELKCTLDYVTNILSYGQDPQKLPFTNRLSQQETINQVINKINKKPQQLPKLQQSNQTMLLNEEFLVDKVDSINKSIYTQRILRSTNRDPPVSTPNKDLISNYISQELLSAFNKIDEHRSQQEISRFSGIHHHMKKLGRSTGRISQRKDQLTPTKYIEKLKIDEKRTTLQLSKHQKLFETQGSDDYLNTFVKQHTHSESLSTTRHETQFKREKIKQLLLHKVDKIKHKQYSYTPVFVSSTTEKKQIFKSVLQPPRIPTPPPLLPVQCQEQLRVCQKFYDNAEYALKFIERQKPFKIKKQ